MRHQLKETYGLAIEDLLNFEGCELALVHAAGRDEMLAEHLIGSFHRHRECGAWNDDLSSLWMMNLDNNLRARVKEYLSMYIDTRLLDVIMTLYNQFTYEEAERLNVPDAWNIYDSLHTSNDATALMQYAVNNDDHIAEQCAKVLLAYI
jgi:hypothetical protein